MSVCQKRRFSSCGISKDDREIACMRRRGGGSMSVDGGGESEEEEECDMVSTPSRRTSSAPLSCIYSKCEESSLLDDLTCKLCNNIYNQPIILNCGHTFCACCLSESPCVSLCKSVQSYCAECGAEIKTKDNDELMRSKLHTVFPYAEYLYKRMKFVEEKRMFMELSDMRNKLVHVRNRFVSFKNEKVSQIPKVQQAFYAYYEKCAVYSKAEREYLAAMREYKALEAAAALFNENRGNVQNPVYETIPATKCCRDSLIDCLSQSTTSGADNTITLYPELLSKDTPPTCRECPSILPILTPDQRRELDGRIVSEKESSKSYGGGCVLLQSLLGGKGAAASPWCPKQLFRSWFCKGTSS